MKTKIISLASIIVCLLFCFGAKGYSQCRMGLASTWTKDSYRYVKVTSQCDVNKTIAVQVKMTNGAWCTAVYEEVGPYGSAEGFCSNPTDTYRWVLLDKGETTLSATEKGLWHNE